MIPMANKVADYVGEVQKEMRKVSWPSRQELISNTAITLVASLVFALLIFGVDTVISRVLELVYGA